MTLECADSKPKEILIKTFYILNIRKMSTVSEFVNIGQPQVMSYGEMEFLNWHEARNRSLRPATTIIEQLAFHRYLCQQILYHRILYQQKTNETGAWDRPVICGHVKLDDGDLRFLVKWNRFGYRTWEPRSSLRNVSDVEKYLRGLENLI